MRKSVGRPFGLALAFVTLVGTALGAGIGFSAATATPATLSWANHDGSSEIAGLAFTGWTPEVNVSGNSGSASVTVSIVPGTGAAGAVLTCGGTGTHGDTFAVSGSPVILNGCSINLDGNGYELTATEAPDGGSTGASLPFDVSGGASHLEFVSAPVSTEAGQPFATTGLSSFAVQVQIENTDNSNVSALSTFASDLIQLKIATGTNPAATLTCAPLAASSGLATWFGCWINLVGSYTLEAVDLTNPFISPAFSSPLFAAFPVTPAPGTQLAFITAPALNSTVPLAPGTFPVVVAEEDQFGNVVTTDSSALVLMSLSENPASATLVCPGIGDALTVIDGIANFSPGCSINEPGTGFQLQALGVGPPVMSPLFNVSSVVIPADVTTLPATAIGPNAAELNGSVNPGGVAQTCFFLYGTASNLAGALATGSVITSTVTTPVDVSIPVGSLVSGATYYFQLNCTDGVGGILNFVAAFVGSVQTEAATGIGANSATLNGLVNPGGIDQTCDYLYSTASDLAGAIISAVGVFGGSVTTAVPIAVNGLEPNTIYYYELSCTNGVGGIMSFETGTNGSPAVIDIAGPDAIGTSIATSQAAFPGDGSAHVVVLARSDNFADALAGDPLAAANDGPLLLTPGAPISSGIDPRVLDEIMRVLPAGGTVYVLGGNEALSPFIDMELALSGFKPVRVAGLTQYGTAVDIAGLLGDPTTIFEVSGLEPYDAMAAGPAAIKEGGAILETDGTTQAPETAAYLAAHPGDTRYTIGGIYTAGGADPTAINVSGPDPSATSAAVAETFFAKAHNFAIASVYSFTDALGGGYFIATNGLDGPLLEVPPVPPLPDSIVAYLNTLNPGAQGYAFGGVLAITPAVLGLVQAAIG